MKLKKNIENFFKRNLILIFLIKIQLPNKLFDKDVFRYTPDSKHDHMQGLIVSNVTLIVNLFKIH